MLFFKRILNFDEDAVVRREKRLARRFDLNPESPLGLVILSPDGPLPAKIKDLSSTGIGFELPAGDPALETGQRCLIRLEIERFSLALHAHVSRAVTSPAGTTTIGADLTDNDYPARRNLVQLLEPIEIGSTLMAIDPASATQTEPGLVSIRYFSSTSSALTVWRDAAERSIEGFEWRLNDYYVRSGAIPPELTIYETDSSGVSGGSNFGLPTLRLSQEDKSEVRRLFNWIVPHLNAGIPSDLCKFLRAYSTLES